MKKQLKESNEDKMLIAINTYLNLFLGKLEEVVDKETGNIYLCEYDDEYTKVLIQKKSLKCWVDFNFWYEFANFFSLQYDEVQSFITRWVEDTYQLKGIDTSRIYSLISTPSTGRYSEAGRLKIPTN